MITTLVSQAMEVEDGLSLVIHIHERQYNGCIFNALQVFSLGVFQWMELDRTRWKFSVLNPAG